MERKGVEGGGGGGGVERGSRIPKLTLCVRRGWGAWRGVLG